MSRETMRAIRVHRFGGPEELQLEEIERPEPGEGELVLRVHSAGVLPVDWKLRQGYFGPNARSLPYIPGSAVAGVVAAVGTGVDGFVPGQAVFGRATNGAYAEYVATATALLTAKPEQLSFNEAATVSAGATTAWVALLLDGELESGQRVLIHGAAGGVGQYAVQIASLKGAHVIATASANNADFVRSLGAETVLDYRVEPFEDVVRDVDLVLDTQGGAVLARSLGVVRRGGRVVTLNGQPDQAAAQERGVTALFGTVHPITREILDEVAGLIVEGKLTPQVGRSFALEEAAQAHELSQHGHGRGRIVLRIAD